MEGLWTPNHKILIWKKFTFQQICDLAGIRTQDPYIKSVLLYQLSYQVGHLQQTSLLKSGAKIGLFLKTQNFFRHL